MRWLAHVAVRANPKRNGVMIRSRRHNFASLPLALSSASENTHWNLSATMLSCPWSIWDSFRGIQSHTHNWSFGWITIKIHNTIKCLKVPTYDETKDHQWPKSQGLLLSGAMIDCPPPISSRRYPPDFS